MFHTPHIRDDDSSLSYGVRGDCHTEKTDKRQYFERKQMRKA